MNVHKRIKQINDDVADLVEEVLNGKKATQDEIDLVLAKPVEQLIYDVIEYIKPVGIDLQSREHLYADGESGVRQHVYDRSQNDSRENVERKAKELGL